MKNFIASIGLVVTWLASGASAQTTGGRPNLLKNSSFEEGQAGWDFAAHEKRGTVAIDNTEVKDGKASIRIDNPAGDDSFLVQTVKVKPGTRYRLSGYIKAKDIVGKGTGGASLSLMGGFEKSESLVKSKGWTKVTFEFDSGAVDTIKVGPRIGHYSTMVMGTAWFDELVLVELGPSKKR